MRMLAAFLGPRISPSNRPEKNLVAADSMPRLLKSLSHTLVLSSYQDQEKSARGEVEQLIEKQKLFKAERERERAEFQTELLAAKDARQKLAETITEMTHEAAASTVRERNLKIELKTLLRARSTVTENLKVSKYKLERSLHERTSELAAALDKLNSHSSLVEAIEREASSVRRTVDETRRLLQAKDEDLMRLQSKLESLSRFDNKVVEKVKSLEQQVRDGRQSLSMKDRVIMELEEKMELLKTDHRLDDLLLFRTIATKENTISKLKGNIQTLESQIRALEVVVERSQVVLRQQEDTLDKTRNELVTLEDTTQKLRARLHEAEEQLSNTGRDMDKLLRTTEEGFRRSAALELQVDFIKKRNEELEMQQMKCPAVDRSTSTEDLDVMNTSSASTCDQSTFTTDLVVARRDDQSGNGDMKLSVPNSRPGNCSAYLSPGTQTYKKNLDDGSHRREHHDGLISTDDVRREGNIWQHSSATPVGQIYGRQTDFVEGSEAADENNAEEQLEDDKFLTRENDQIPSIDLSHEFQQLPQPEKITHLPVDIDHSIPVRVRSSLEPDNRTGKGDHCDETRPPPTQEAPTDLLSFSPRPMCDEGVAARDLAEAGPQHILGSRGRALSPDLEFDVEMLLSSANFPKTHRSLAGDDFRQSDAKESISRHVQSVPSTPTPPGAL